jgi:hypothetical protein
VDDDQTPRPWELRSARRYGSDHVGFFPSRELAEDEARRRISRTGSVGRIEHVSVETRVVYYDEHEEDS